MSYETIVTFDGDGVETDFVVPFGFLASTDLDVTVDDAAASFTVDGSTVTITPAPASGTANVVITRVTNIDDPINDFTGAAAVFAEDVDTSINQLLYSVQELHTRLDGISVDGGAIEGEGMPAVVAADKFLVSASDGSGGYEWVVKSVAQVQTLLGVASPVSIPAPVAGNRFITTAAGTADYTLITLAATKTLLGIPTFNLPALNGAANHFLISDSGGTTVAWRSGTYARSFLGLGTAATANTGTGVGNVVVLISDGGGGSALPAVSGEFLTDIVAETDCARWDWTGSEDILSTASWPTVTDGAVLTQTIASTGGWDSALAGGVTLTTGKYLVRVEILEVGGTGTGVSYRISASGTVTPSSMTGLQTTLGYQSLEGVFNVTGASSDVTIEGDSTGSALQYARITKVRLHIYKIG